MAATDVKRNRPPKGMEHNCRDSDDGLDDAARQISCCAVRSMLADTVIANRAGHVLLKDTILKADHFPGCQNKSLLPSFEDAPNFRQVPELPIYGVAIPTVAGLHLVLDILEAKSKKVLWHNMREEPLLYIKGHPFVVRDADKPFANLEYTGINRKRVEDMEVRLKQDVLQEMHQYEGSVLLADESVEAGMFLYWDKVLEKEIQTPQEVFCQLTEQEGYHVDYLRVPVTDEKAPKEVDCDLLVQRCWKPGQDTSLVFNCQMGRGRTTTGMIIAALLHLRRLGAFPQSSESVWRPQWLSSTAMPAKESSDSRQGYYGVVRSLLRTLEHGRDAKHVLDAVINANSQMQNLREAIHKYREQLCLEQNERKRNTLLRVALEYLERYCVLIVFAAYISHPQFDPTSANCVTFEAFMSRRPEFRSVLQRLLRRNPMSALGLHIGAEDTRQFIRRESMDRAGLNLSSTHERHGKVLGQHTILKEDHFPGIQSEHLPQLIDGAPNFRGVSGVPVYGVGMPTVDGIRKILTYIAADSVTSTTCISWFNWREEPLVYINGRPFVLREDKRPFKNLKEYTNIDGHRLEEMEERLKQDVLNEAAANNGCILVALETPVEKEGVGILEDKWETVDSESSVQTPASIYAMLQREGYTVDYHRLPLTDGTTPDVLDVDQILDGMSKNKAPAAMIFSCQNGVGRTTMGMAIASLAYFQERRTASVNIRPAVIDHHTDARVDGYGSSETETETESSGEENVEWQEGEFLAVRRLTHLLDNGHEAKRMVRMSIDCCDVLVNIRKEISQFRKGHRRRRPETTTHKHAAYTRSIGYLHRFCFLIAVGGYIIGPRSTRNISFQQWMDSRPDITVALEMIFHNPTAALSFLLPRPLSNESLNEVDAVPAKKEQRWLQERQFPVLNARSILKGGHSGHRVSMLSGIPDVKCVRHKHVYTIGNPSVRTLRKLLEYFRNDPTAPKTILLRDIREELVVYINGLPYIRRDLERPVSSLYHAGVATEDLERMEEGLKEDVLQEAQIHDGTVLIHHEIPVDDHLKNQSSSQGIDHHRNAITRNIESTPSVIPKKADVKGGVCTPKDIYRDLVDEGYLLRFARVPLSRSRTPKASDLDQLDGNISETDAAVHIIVARSSSGSSARYAAAFLSLFPISENSPRRSLSFTEPPESKFALGEYRSIMHLCRVVPNGLRCKAQVDEAIDDCVRIGSLREDILSCMYAIGTHPQTKQLGLHYLKRYFYLVAFQAYRTQSHDESFEDWVTHRKELCHLLGTLKLE